MNRLARHVAALAAATLVALTGCAPHEQNTAERGCARAVLRDWSDGAIEGVYNDNCYVAAIDALPEDLRAYTSAGDDIARALRSRRTPADPSAGESRRLAQAQARSTETAAVGRAGLEEPPLPVVLLASLLVVLAAAGLVSLALRHRRERS